MKTIKRWLEHCNDLFMICFPLQKNSSISFCQNIQREFFALNICRMIRIIPFLCLKRTLLLTVYPCPSDFWMSYKSMSFWVLLWKTVSCSRLCFSPDTENTFNFTIFKALVNRTGRIQMSPKVSVDYSGIQVTQTVVSRRVVELSCGGRIRGLRYEETISFTLSTSEGWLLAVM